MLTDPVTSVCQRGLTDSHTWFCVMYLVIHLFSFGHWELLCAFDTPSPTGDFVCFLSTFLPSWQYKMLQAISFLPNPEMSHFSKESWFL